MSGLNAGIHLVDGVTHSERLSTQYLAVTIVLMAGASIGMIGRLGQGYTIFG